MSTNTPEMLGGFEVILRREILFPGFDAEEYIVFDRQNRVFKLVMCRISIQKVKLDTGEINLLFYMNFTDTDDLLIENVTPDYVTLRRKEEEARVKVTEDFVGYWTGKAAKHADVIKNMDGL